MNEPYYSIICNLMRLSPIMLMGITWLAAYYLLPNYNKFRFLLTLVVGYIIGVFSVWWYWDFAAEFAPTEEVAVEILKKNGAPMVAAPFLMPIYLVFYFCIMWPITWIVTRFCPRNNV